MSQDQDGRDGRDGRNGQGGPHARPDRHVRLDRPVRPVRLVRLLGFSLAAFLPACRGTLSPLSNRLKIGQEAYVIFVADGEDGLGDLFASPPSGGTALQVTFTRVDERAPALSPDGSMVAFVRSRAPGDTAGAGVVVLNLVNGAERRLEARASAVAWASDGQTLYLRTEAGILATPAPPLATQLAPAAGSAESAETAADSAFRVVLGDPPRAEARACGDRAGLCARLATGEVALLSATGLAPARWGSDSVTYLEHGVYVIRPLGGGKTRELRWTTPVGHPRELSYFGGPRSGAVGAGREASP